MSYAIIGFGKIGHALAKAFARNGMAISVATTRDPESFASAAAAIGPESSAGNHTKRLSLSESDNGGAACAAHKRPLIHVDWF